MSTVLRDKSLAKNGVDDLSLRAQRGDVMGAGATNIFIYIYMLAYAQA